MCLAFAKIHLVAYMDAGNTQLNNVHTAFIVIS